MHPDHRRTCWLIGLATALRLVVAAALPLGIDESYAVVVSRRIALSYFDHPPAVFWLAHLAALTGGESPFVLRLPFVLLFAGTCWLLYLFTARLFGTRAGFWATAAAQCIPVFSLSSGSWVLPDGPLLFGSAAAGLALAHALPLRSDLTPTSPSANGARWTAWIALGLALGVAGLSKYHAALLGAGVAGFLVSDPSARRWLSRPQPYAALLIAVLCTTPVFLWNAEHDWISFRFQAGRAAGSGNAITALLQNLGGQAGYLFPWFWVPLVVLLTRGLRTGVRDRATWLCVCLGALPVLVFTLASLGGRAGLPHWPAPGFFMLLPLLGAAIARWEQRAPSAARHRMIAAGAVFAALVSVVVTHAATGWMANVVPSLHRRDPAFELLEYRSVRDTLAASRLLDDARFVATTDWLRGAKIGYALGPSRPTLVLNDDARHFRFAVDADSLSGADGLLLVKVDGSGDAARSADRYRGLFDSVRFVRTLPVLRGADTALMLNLFAARGLHRGWNVASTR
ncbi:MAG: glycosyltransferase family 39 protein [Gemmatimonadaceae bacterium]|nr:glycosyltransferase family 39 protein [Gemmatimonadaceae bacterium]